LDEKTFLAINTLQAQANRRLGARDELDTAGVKIREDELRQTRALKHHPLSHGGGRGIWDMDPETYAAFTDLYDRSTSPKLGGVRFVNTEQSARVDAIAADDRTPVQLASDAFIQLLGLGADANPAFILGSGAPIIRITVTEEDLTNGTGFGRIEGTGDTVSITTTKRLLCTGDSIRIGFDTTGNVLNMEAEQRLYSRRQREVLAVKFGGCMDPNCDRPPAWCEAHHILHWARDNGKTVLENGILLCKWHHLKYHNDGYEIERDTSGNYWQIPPEKIDPTQTPITMPPKTTTTTGLRRTHRAG
jgi:hypothetical protein